LISRTVEGARREATKRVLSERFTVDADFVETVPDADLYLLKMILHDWDDEQSIRILRNCRASVRAGGSALIAEMVIDELDGSNKATRADMNMLSVTDRGMERDLEEYDAATFHTEPGATRGPHGARGLARSG
jgi:O-methyltransferase domain